jgi:HEAT repeat protein
MRVVRWAFGKERTIPRVQGRLLFARGPAAAISAVLIVAVVSCRAPEWRLEEASSGQASAESSSSLEQVRELLMSADVAGRLEGFEMIEKLADPALLSELEEGIVDRSEMIRKVCMSALVELGEPSVPVLTKALEHPDWRVRNNAVVALGHIKGASAIPLVKGMVRDAHERVRIATVQVMADSGGEDAAQFLTEQATEQSPGVRIEICKALGKIGTDNALRALPVFLTDENYGVRYYAAEAVARGGDEAVPYLVDVLQGSADVTARSLAARALGQTKSAQAVQPLIGALEDSSSAVRRLAIWSLGNIGAWEARAALEAVQGRGSCFERRYAMYALDEINRSAFLETETPVSRMY